MSKKNKQYLGDAVYADWDGMHVVLTTSDGVYESNRILLEDQVMDQLIKYYNSHGAKKDESGRSPEGESEQH